MASREDILKTFELEKEIPSSRREDILKTFELEKEIPSSRREDISKTFELEKEEPAYRANREEQIRRLKNIFLGMGYGLAESAERALRTVRGEEDEKALIPERLRIRPEIPEKIISGVERIKEQFRPEPDISGGIGALLGETAAYLALPGPKIPPGTRLAGKVLGEIPRAALFGALESPKAPVVGGLTGTAGALIGVKAGELLSRAGGVVPAAIKSFVTPAIKKTAKKAIKMGKSRDLYPYIEERTNFIRDELRGVSSEETSTDEVFHNLQRHYSELYGNRTNELGDVIDLHGNPIDTENFKYIHPDESYVSLKNKASQEARKIDLNKFDRSEMDNAINKMRDEIGRRYEIAPTGSIFQKQAAELFDVLSDIKKLRVDSFNDADAAESMLNSLYNQFGEKKLSPLIKSAIHKVKEGIDKSVSKTYEKDPKLFKMWKEATKQFSEKLVPFKEIAYKKESPFYKRYMGKKTLTNLVNEYIIPGDDKLLDNFLKIIPDKKTRELSAFDYLKTYHGKSTANDAASLVKKYESLSKYQRRKLLPDHYEELDELEKLYEKAPIAFKKPTEIMEREKIPGEGISEKLARTGLIGALLGVPYSPHVVGAGLLGLAGRKVGAVMSRREEELIRRFMESPEGRQEMMNLLRRIGEKGQLPTERISPILRGLATAATTRLMGEE